MGRPHMTDSTSSAIPAAPDLTPGTVSDVAQAATQAIGGDRWVDPELVSLARRAAAQGTVLLRNNGALPLSPGSPVAVLGRVQVDWFAVGYGSGGDVNPPYTTRLLDCLEEAGVAVVGELAAAYRSWCADNVPPTGEWGQWPRYYQEMPVSPPLLEAAADQADTALVVVGRAAGEDRENLLEPGSYYLTQDERTLLGQAVNHFARVVVIVNSGNVMDLSWAEEFGVDALLLAWPGGMEGARALTDVLTGALEPGGRLTDTIARRYEDYPSAAFFGGTEFNDYAEDILVGYRYFESLAPQEVAYPFGFGLGYTSWRVAPGQVHLERGSGCVTVEARVTNTGARPGATVVQVYAGAPRSGPGAGGAASGSDRGPVLPVPERTLVAFGRTRELAPGQSQDLSWPVPLEHLASFDDSGATGFPDAWVLQAGEYPLMVGLCVRDAVEAGSVLVERTEVLRRLDQALAPSPEHPFRRMTLERDAAGTPALAWEDVPVGAVDLRERILAGLPRDLPLTGDRGIRWHDVAEGRAELDDFLAQFTPEMLADLTFGDITMNSPLGVPGNAGAFGGVTPALREMGVPPVVTTDGPSGIRVSAYASLLPCGTALASTWDPDLVEGLYALHGAEMVREGSDVLLAPGMNIHRNPLCGRNFEYFSEDPLLTGLIAAAVVRGIQSQGVSACPKHFVANNQETARTVCDSRVSARALREIYLRGFEICLVHSSPRVIMTSYNKVNGQWSHYNYDLATTILRDQWGYEGLVITDWWMRYAPDPLFPGLADSATRVRAQVDVLMPGARTHDAVHDDGHDDAVLEGLAAGKGHERGQGLTLGELQRCARNVLRATLSIRLAATRH